MKIYPGRLNFLLLTLAFCSAAFAQTPYNRLYGTYATETGKAGFIRSDSTIYALGTSSAFTGLSSQVYLLKTDKDGNLLWSRFFGGSGVDDATGMYYHTDTSIYLVASSYQGAGKGYDIKVIKTDMNGVAQWEKNYGTTDWDIPSRIIRISDSSFAICGQTYGNTLGLSDGMIFAFNENGDSLWFKNLGTVNDDMLHDLVLKNADTIAACGETYAGGIKHGWLTELSITTQSAVSYTYGLDYNYAFNAMEQMPGGGYITAITTDSAGNNDMFIWKIHPYSHDVVQSISMYAPADDYSTDIAQYNSEYFILGNTSSYGLGGYDPVVYRFDTLGGWFINSYTFGTSEDNFANDIVMNNNGSFFLVGTSPKSFGPDDLWIVNMDNTYDVYDIPDNAFDPNNVQDLNAPGIALTIYPNPCLNDLYIRTSLSIMQVTMFDNTGRMVDTFSGNNLQQVDLSGTAPGIYQLVMTTSDGTRVVRQLAVK